MSVTTTVAVIWLLILRYRRSESGQHDVLFNDEAPA